ncbi:competence type IV pilus minor pilin ComGF [Dolosigranulum savutiense]|uniref:Competence type IV pilus minor pilin ComGF n=1 Tax=Dolosigranulum savutiense TaxID=3110288 RepID=A0AB74TSE8_9LACT
MNWKNDQGFTLLEVIVALSITSLCLLLLSSGISSLAKAQEGIETDRQIDWHMFVNQFEYYIEGSELMTFEPGQLVVREEDQEVVEYREINGNFIRRRKNGTQQMIMDIEQLTLHRRGNAMTITGVFPSGEVYEARIWVSSWHEE